MASKCSWGSSRVRNIHSAIAKLTLHIVHTKSNGISKSRTSWFSYQTCRDDLCSSTFTWCYRTALAESLDIFGHKIPPLTPQCLVGCSTAARDLVACWNITRSRKLVSPGQIFTYTLYKITVEWRWYASNYKGCSKCMRKVRALSSAYLPVASQRLAARRPTESSVPAWFDYVNYALFFLKRTWLENLKLRAHFAVGSCTEPNHFVNHCRREKGEYDREWASRGVQNFSYLFDVRALHGCVSCQLRTYVPHPEIQT